MIRLLALSGVLSLSVPALAADDIATLEARARDAYRAKDYAAAAKAFGELLVRLPATDPARAQTQYNRGRALQKAEQPCVAAEAFLGYLANPDAAKPREARRRSKARKYLGTAQSDCAAQRRTAARPAPAPPVSPPPAAPPPPVSQPTGLRNALVLEAGVGSGVHLSSPVERARTTVIAGLGYRTGDLLFDLTGEFAVETPEGADGVVLMRPGLRWYVADPVYLRASLPVLLLPLTALGVQGAVGVQWPADGTMGVFTEIGGLGWFSDPVQVLIDGRVGVQASF